MNSFEIPAQNHTELNPVLWNGEALKPDVEHALLKIAKAYWKFLSIDTSISDIVISGSQANFNYSKHSDIDLHLIVSYDNVQCDMAVDQLFDTKRKLWKEQHDIDIHGIPVEVYVEDTAKPAVTASYSLLKNIWVNPPKQEKAEASSDRIQRLCKAWMKLIIEAIKSKDLEQIDQAKELLWTYRKVGLAREGEMGVPNLVFKTLRNAGITEMLLMAIRKINDRKLSLEDAI
jgi:hypothetical protein